VPPGLLEDVPLTVRQRWFQQDGTPCTMGKMSLSG
jgi:hypothetical protein